VIITKFLYLKFGLKIQNENTPTQRNEIAIVIYAVMELVLYMLHDLFHLVWLMSLAVIRGTNTLRRSIQMADNELQIKRK